MYVIGVDLSLRSPGFAVYYNSTWILYYFAQNNKQQGHIWTNEDGSIKIISLPRIPASNCSDILRYAHIIHAFEVDILSKLDRSIPIRILLEDYAFVARKFAGHHKKLQELGGIFKYSLYTNNITDVECITSARWKKMATGNGRITKRGMVAFIKANKPNLYVL